jgi:hypothetical protein
MVKFLLKQYIFNYFSVIYYALLFLFFNKICFDLKLVLWVKTGSRSGRNLAFFIFFIVFRSFYEIILEF